MFDLAIKREVPADVLRALEIECNQLPVSVAQAQDEEVPDNDDILRPIRAHPIDTSGLNILQLQVIAGTSTLRNEVKAPNQPPNLPEVSIEGLESYDSIEGQ